MQEAEEKRKMNGETVIRILSEVAGLLGITANFISFQTKKQSALLWYRTATEMFFAVQYLLLGAYTGLAMNLIGSLRNLVFVREVKRGKSTVPARFVFSGLFLAFAALTWAGWQSALSGVAKVISTFSYGCSNLMLVRFLALVTGGSWFTYNLTVRSYAGCVCEAVTLLSALIGLFRIDLPRFVRKCRERKEERRGA